MTLKYFFKTVQLLFKNFFSIYYTSDIRFERKIPFFFQRVFHPLNMSARIKKCVLDFCVLQHISWRNSN